jgi:hypothetical protein
MYSEENWKKYPTAIGDRTKKQDENPSVDKKS